ncbi:hypothetical protein F8M41_008756 [Gigaspora margarita]|uniref:Uncharacterized protein n=1 Tax=Gigaspora margarita TaxID=4874 RepID=A0A8H4A244_GIGMA|nr:hypothetical protein F8M41_008756 [Gigaspora margarita]
MKSEMKKILPKNEDNAFEQENNEENDDDTDFSFQEKNDCQAAKNVILDPSTISRFEPSDHNVFHYIGKTDMSEMCLVGMKHGEVLCRKKFPLKPLKPNSACILL